MVFEAQTACFCNRWTRLWARDSWFWNVVSHWFSAF